MEGGSIPKYHNVFNSDAATATDADAQCVQGLSCWFWFFAQNFGSWWAPTNGNFVILSMLVHWWRYRGQSNSTIMQRICLRFLYLQAAEIKKRLGVDVFTQA